MRLWCGTRKPRLMNPNRELLSVPQTNSPQLRGVEYLILLLRGPYAARSAVWRWIAAGFCRITIYRGRVIGNEMRGAEMRCPWQILQPSFYPPPKFHRLNRSARASDSGSTRPCPCRTRSRRLRRSRRIVKAFHKALAPRCIVEERGSARRLRRSVKEPWTVGRVRRASGRGILGRGLLAATRQPPCLSPY